MYVRDSQKKSRNVPRVTTWRGCGELMFGFMKHRIDNATRWQLHLTALQQFVTRTGSARVPSTHTEVVEGRNVALGAWVGYMRQRNRAGLLSSERKKTLEGISGWAWGPLRPGPATNEERDKNILALRSQGLSLETIASKFGISRQRVHQIARSHTNADA